MTLVKKLTKKVLTTTAVVGIVALFISKATPIEFKTVSNVERIRNVSLFQSPTNDYRISFNDGEPIIESVYISNLSMGLNQPPKVGDRYLKCGNLIGPLRMPYERLMNAN